MSIHITRTPEEERNLTELARAKPKPDDGHRLADQSRTPSLHTHLRHRTSVTGFGKVNQCLAR
jgi:hypothetical protein